MITIDVLDSDPAESLIAATDAITTVARPVVLIEAGLNNFRAVVAALSK